MRVTPVHARCPACGKLHVDEGEWAARAHHVHRCVDDAAGAGCGAEWDLGYPSVGVLPVQNVSARMFAEDRSGVFYNQGRSRRFVEMCGAKPQDIVVVDVREDPEGRYYGWVEAGSAEPTLIWPSPHQRFVCFQYGDEAAEKAGKGRRVRLTCSLVSGP